MFFFRRRSKPTTAPGVVERSDAEEPVSGARTVHERIEVTVEREWVSMVVRKPPGTSIVKGMSPETGATTEAEAKTRRELMAPDTEFPEKG